MLSIKKIGQLLDNYFNSYQPNKILNIRLGKNGRIHTNYDIRMNDRLSKYINDGTMGAFDNYAKHEGINVYIKQLDNDLFDDLQISIIKKSTKKEFPINIKEKKVPDFLKELYEKTQEALHKKKNFDIKDTDKKAAQKNILKAFIDKIDYYVNNRRFELMKKYTEKHQSKDRVQRVFSDILEEVDYDKIQHKNA